MTSVLAAVLVAIAGSAPSVPPASEVPIRPQIVVSDTTALDPSGQTLTVSGRGFDESRGIYVAFCVVPPPGQMPSPCGGGVDLEGGSGASQWISSAPPDYGTGLARPYGPGGTFDATIRVSAMLSPEVDCRLVQCAVVTRSDHTRLADRTLDVIVPVTFGRAPDPRLDAVPSGTIRFVPAVPLTLPQLDAPAAAVTSKGPSAPVVGTAALAPTRGPAPTWPIWVGTALIATVLLVTSPRRRRRGTGGGS